VEREEKGERIKEKVKVSGKKKSKKLVASNQQPEVRIKN